MTVLRFPEFKSPPLTSNQRLHWAPKKDLTREIRQMTAYKAKWNLQPMPRCEVELVWYVTTKHRRDADNVVPTLKAMCDGLVDAGVVPDDTPDLMVKKMPRIVYIGPGLKTTAQYMELHVNETGDAA